jgi:hypothetical protein
MFTTEQWKVIALLAIAVTLVLILLFGMDITE